MTRSTAAPPIIEVTDLTKSYRHPVLRGIDLRVQEGEIQGLLGANGAGKTTTVEIIAGLRHADGGRVRVLGLDPRTDRRKLRTVLGVQLQDAELHYALTVAELVALYRSFYRDPRPAPELLALVDLSDETQVRFDRLSGGQQQRLSVALALAGRPRVVILDELTTGLDPHARRRIWEALERLRDEGVTVLLVSHAMDEVERLCDRIAVLADGRVVADGTAAELCAAAGEDDLESAYLTLTTRENR